MKNTTLIALLTGILLISSCKKEKNDYVYPLDKDYAALISGTWILLQTDIAQYQYDTLFAEISRNIDIRDTFFYDFYTDSSLAALHTFEGQSVDRDTIPYYLIDSTLTLKSVPELSMVISQINVGLITLTHRDTTDNGNTVTVTRQYMQEYK